jgi:hypothetical protein
MNDCFCTKTYQCLSCENLEIRAQAIAENRALTRKVAECGTRAGYNRHLKLKEPTCQLCKDAQTKAVIRWKRERVAQ